MLKASELEKGDQIWIEGKGAMAHTVAIVVAGRVKTNSGEWVHDDLSLLGAYRIPTKPEHVKVGDTLRVVKENDNAAYGRVDAKPGPFGSTFTVTKVHSGGVSATNNDSGWNTSMSFGDYLSCCIVIPQEEDMEDSDAYDEYRYDEAPHVCEEHPLKEWPHGDCPGPGVPLSEQQLLLLVEGQQACSTEEPEPSLSDIITELVEMAYNMGAKHQQEMDGVHARALQVLAEAGLLDD